MNSNPTRKTLRYRKYSHMKYGVTVDGKEQIFPNSHPPKAIYRHELKKAGLHHTQKGVTA